ncbi:MAG: ATP-dependent chaperone ClpB, partial [Actinobacteria bacterium]|nr:ATP-dependent chaperone ClpB [Actinomycetota bacterium]
MDIQFTTKSQDALGAAVRIAAANGNPQVEPSHLLDSLLQQGEGIATALLSAVGVDVPGLTFQVRGALKTLPSASGSNVSAPQLSSAAYAVLNAAETFAKERGDEYVSTEHLLIALSKAGGPGVSDRLAQYGATPARLMDALEQVKGSARVTSKDPEQTFQ